MSLLLVYKLQSSGEDDAPYLQRFHADSQIIAFEPGVKPDDIYNKRAVFTDWDDESMYRYGKTRKCINDKLSIPTDLIGLEIPSSDPELWEWIANRVSTLWIQWTDARQQLEQSHALTNFTMKRILIIPGVLMGTNFARRRSIRNGGPLGELLQWADLIAGLYVLGHNVILEQNTKLATIRLLDAMSGQSSCGGDYDMIYLDNLALHALPVEVKKAYRCRLRLLDVYGTQAMYNDPVYRELHNLHAPAHAPATPAMLNLKQYYTFYPMTPDNTFLGFVVSKPAVRDNGTKENIAVLYGKDARYIRGKENYIKLLTKYVDVHYTMNANLRLNVPGTLVNDGVLKKDQYADLLNRAKLVIGLGAPIEGTGAMEALAHGCIFINPSFTGDAKRILINRKKPTQRLISSQIPYLEQYIGPPHVVTVNTDNSSEVVAAIEQILKWKPLAPFIPTEFTVSGYLERLGLYVQHHNFCTNNQETRWPPLSYLLSTVTSAGVSCTDACHSSGYVCEPAFFSYINTPVFLSSNTLPCNVTTSDADIFHPSYTNTTTRGRVCILQEEAQLYSCEGSHSDYTRICPCRRYVKHQMAFPRQSDDM